MTSPPYPDGIPDEFPVFPLSGALLLPGGKLPLNIFEPRYLALVEDSLAAGRMFGMIQPDPGMPRAPHGPGLYRCGCLGRLSSFSEAGDGRYLITLTGVIRFTVQRETGLRRGYRRVAADVSPWEADRQAERAMLPATDRDHLLAALRDYFNVQAFKANWSALADMPDADLVTTLCMACPFEPAEKQALLEAPDLPARTAMLLALLRMHATPAHSALRPS